MPLGNALIHLYDLTVVHSAAYYIVMFCLKQWLSFSYQDYILLEVCSLAESSLGSSNLYMTIPYRN